MKKDIIKNKLSKYKNVIIFVSLILVISFITIGYALYGKVLNFSGNILVQKVGTVEITNITLVSSNNVSSSSAPTYSNKQANFNVTFNGTTGAYEIVYLVEVTNTSTVNYVYSNFAFTSTVNPSSGTTLNINVTGITNGDIITPSQVKTFTVTITLTATDRNLTYNVSASGTLDVSKNTSGSLVGSLLTTNINLKSPNTSATVQISVMNTYSYQRVFSFSLGNNNFNLTGTTSFTIPANTTQTFSITVVAKTSAIFLTGSETSTVVLSSNGIANTVAGTVTIAVDIYVAPDTAIPEIGPITLTINNTVGSFSVGWSRLDSGGTNIVNYTILLYNSSDSLLQTVNTGNSSTTYTFNSISAGTYYVKIYGQDAAGNNGSSYVSSATTSTIYCRKSNSLAMKWVFSVTNTFSRISSTGASTVNRGTTYTATLSVTSGSYSLPSSITVTMGGTTLTQGTGYSWTQSSGALSIPNVTGDLTITATATFGCLVEGTKITLANGSTKNIENIGYDDLLLVWNYETGTFTYEYPIWLEQSLTANHYLLITFSDGSTLKIVGEHGLFDINSNLFISVADEANFKVGTKVAKINASYDGFDEVTVVNIEYKTDAVKYYHVVSTRYYDVIANGILTTDGTVILSNLYGFTDKLTWTPFRDQIFSDNNLYTYEDFADILPYYMFKGMRVEEAKFLSIYGLSKEIFTQYLLKNQLNEGMLLAPITNNNGKRLWMATTSDDEVSDTNKKDFLLEEGSIYTLKEPKDGNLNEFIGWYNTADGKYYQPNNKVQIFTGTHFVAMWKK